MLFSTPTQFAVLALCLIAGWIFGLATHPGGKKAKARLRTTEAEYAAYKKDADARIKDAELRAKNAEADRDRVATVAPVTTSTTGVTSQNEARPAFR